jgi:hypothetical protein
MAITSPLPPSGDASDVSFQQSPLSSLLVVTLECLVRKVERLCLVSGSSLVAVSTYRIVSGGAVGYRKASSGEG